MTVTPQITFVCIVESGWLEAQAVRMVESLRRWGGEFANAPILAVTPRLGPPLARKTHQVFDKFHVEYIRSHEQSKYTWFPFLNKPLCLALGEKHSTSENMVYLDADLLIVDEPNQLILKKGEDFLACTSDKIGGTTGPEDPLEPFWKKACNLIGIDIQDLPWVKTELEGERIRLYWNGGVFAYRRSTGFVEQYLQTTLQLLESNIVSQVCGVYFHEQIAMALTVARMGIHWGALPYSYNYAMSSLIHDEWYDEAQLKAAQIIHYHDSMWPTFWPEFLKCMRNTHPQVADWLDPLGPMKNEAPVPWRVTSQLLKHFRSQQASTYRKLATVS